MFGACTFIPDAKLGAVTCKRWFDGSLRLVRLDRGDFMTPKERELCENVVIVIVMVLGLIAIGFAIGFAIGSAVCGTLAR